jgi:hypothetical protein
VVLADTISEGEPLAKVWKCLPVGLIEQLG